MSKQLCWEVVELGDEIPPLVVTVDQTQMFFFSAATYNGRRIHWATAVEGYDDVLVQGPLQSALLAWALTDRIGGRGRLVRYSVQNRAVAYPGDELTFGGVVTAKRMEDGAARRCGHRRATGGRRAHARHGYRRAPASRGALMTGRTGLRSEAAIVGIAELPAQRKQTRPELFTLDHRRQRRGAVRRVPRRYRTFTSNWEIDCRSPARW